MYFLKKKIFHFFWIFGRLFPNNHRNMFCRFHVSLINGFPLPKTWKMPDFRKSCPNQKGTKQAHTMKFTLLPTWNFLQNLSMWGFFHFLTCVMFDRTFEMNIDVVKTSNSIFFTKLFQMFPPFYSTERMLLCILM